MASRIIAMPITLEGLDPDLRTALLGLEKCVVNSVNSLTDFNAMLFESDNFSPKTKTIPVYAGLADAAQWDGISAITPSQLSYLYDITATQYYYANGISFTFDSLTFDEYDLNAKQSKGQGISAEAKRQKVGAAQLFNNAFTTNWFDGVPFFASNHPNSPVIGGTQSNLISGALSHDTLQDAIDAMCAFTDPMGRALDVQPTELWVDMSKISLGEYVLNSGNALKSGTGDNDNNPFKGIKLVPYPYFSTTTKWALRGRGRNGNPCKKSRKLYKLMAPRENDAHGYQRDLIWCEAYWMEDWTTWVGSLGT